MPALILDEYAVEVLREQRKSDPAYCWDEIWDGTYVVFPIPDKTDYQGGPDFLVEVVMPGDRCREKLDFYASIGTQEVLVVDRDPWRFELYRRRGNKLQPGEMVRLGDKPLRSRIIPFTFEFIRKRRAVKIRIVHTQTGQEWVG
jgi:hypothetical protein